MNNLITTISGKTWETQILNGTSWNQALHDGVFAMTEQAAEDAESDVSDSAGGFKFR